MSEPRSLSIEEDILVVYLKSLGLCNRGLGVTDKKLEEEG